MDIASQLFAPSDDFNRLAAHDLTDDLTPDVKVISLSAPQQPRKADELRRLQNRRLALRYDRLDFVIQSLFQAACIFLVAKRLARQF
jgi:hypothetical protein